MPKEIDPQTLTLDEVQRLLGRTLSDLEANVVAALSGPDDEQASLRELDEHREKLEGQVDLLRRKLSHLTDTAPVDLNQVVSGALDDVLMELEKPLALHVEWRPELPAPRVPERALASLLTNAITTLARHAEPGDRVSFATGVEGDEVVLTIALNPDRNGSGQIAQPEALEAQCRSLTAHVHEIGGRFLVERDRGLRMLLGLWVGPDQGGA